jgi:TRAP-type transport system large permease protein
LVGLLLLGVGSPIVIAQQMYEGLRSFPLAAIPLFLLMANLMTVSGVTSALVRFSTSLVGHIRGSLALGSITASTIMAGISGSCLADTTAVGSVMIPTMVEDGYPRDFAGAVTGAANIVGPIIPPSILMILYGFASEQSIIRLFLGGIIPGLMLSITFGIYAYFVCRRRSYGSIKPKFVWQEAVRSLMDSLPALIIPLLILLGIVGGVFTLTESAGAAALYALLYAIVSGAFRKNVPWRNILGAFQRTAIDTVVVLIMVGASRLLAWVLTMSQLPQSMAAELHGLGYVGTMVLVNLILLTFGMFMEPAPSILLAASILIPVMKDLNVDLIHFGIIMVVNLQIGVLTPPVASAAYVTSRIAGISFEEQIKALLPFILLGFITLTLVTFIPELSLRVPQLIMGQ